MAISIDYKLTRSPMDEIDFILLMWSLRVMADRGVVLNRHGAMGERDGESFPHWPVCRDGTGDA